MNEFEFGLEGVIAGNAVIVCIEVITSSFGVLVPSCHRQRIAIFIVSSADMDL